jgi:hypothetical protein
MATSLLFFGSILPGEELAAILDSHAPDRPDASRIFKRHLKRPFAQRIFGPEEFA